MAKIKVEVGLVDRKDREPFMNFVTESGKEALSAGAVMLGAVTGKVAIGALVGYIDQDGCFMIESLYVSPDYRKKGAGAALVGRLKEIMDETDGAVYSRIGYCEYDKDTEALTAFLKAVGYKSVDRGDRLYEISIADLEDDKLFPKKYQNRNMKTFAELTDRELKRLAVASRERYRDQPEEGFISPHVDRELSYVYERKGIISAYLVCDDTEDKEVTVSAVYAPNARQMSALLRSFAAGVRKKYKAKKTKIFIPTTTPVYDGPFEAIFPGVKNIERNYERI